MRPRLLLFAAILALGFAPAPFPRTSRAAKEVPDLERMQGTWTIVERRSGKRRLAQENAQVTLRGTRWNFIFDGEVRSEWEIKLDPAARPRALNYAGAGITPSIGLVAIYEFEGDTLTVCYDQGRVRPANFTGDGGHWVMILRRTGR